MFLTKTWSVKIKWHNATLTFWVDLGGLKSAFTWIDSKSSVSNEVWNNLIVSLCLFCIELAGWILQLMAIMWSSSGGWFYSLLGGFQIHPKLIEITRTLIYIYYFFIFLFFFIFFLFTFLFFYFLLFFLIYCQSPQIHQKLIEITRTLIYTKAIRV